eukprot:Sspe_Gene.141::Locus_44_Transcript_1_1_Confidence_1.000_Length_2153::g.141::m.141/K03253/EIF3B; translation initiation factor 3 subunit B
MNMEKFVEENLYKYMCDPLAREQYFIRYQSEGGSALRKVPQNQVEIYWNNYQVVGVTDQPDIMSLVYKKTNWTQHFAKWSPLGTYLITFSEAGLDLWGGESWQNLGTFAHSDVQFIDWSPKERYLITWANDGQLIVWDVAQGKRLRRFRTTASTQTWPLFKWSHDEVFLAKQVEQGIMVYTVQGMKLITPDTDKQTSLHVLKVQAIEWSPTDNYFAYWVPEEGNTPARVVLIEVVEKTRGEETTYEFIPRAKRNLYNVTDIRMTWHPQGDFLACKIGRTTKKNGKMSCNAYELFRTRHKDWAVETIELKDRDSSQIIAFGFEPRGYRFAIIHGVSDVKPSVSFYTMGGVKTGQVKLLKTLHEREVNRLYWSPRGKYILLAGIKQPFNGKVLEFWNADDLVEPISTNEHFMCSHINWDPSGRFVTTFVSQVETTIDSGFKIWTFQGKLVVEKKIEKFLQFEWRPRLPSLLTDKELKQVNKTKKEWSKKYELEEERILKKDEIERNERMATETRDFYKRLKAIKEHFAEARELRIRLQKETNARLDEWVDKSEEVEEILDRKEIKEHFAEAR